MSEIHLVVGLDIGTTKICALVGRKNEYGKVEILGMGKAPSAGVQRGVVANIDKTVEGIMEAVKLAEERSGVEIKDVTVGIAGQHIKSIQHRGSYTRENNETEISQYDVDRLIENIFKLTVNPGEEIIHVLPQEFTLDGTQITTEPVGMNAILMEANCHVITGQISAAKNITKCVNKSGLQLETMTLEPLASAEAVLTDEEKEEGVVLVDIGGGTTDIAIFYEGIIRHTAVIPFGGNIITEDIREGCGVMRNQAEQLKVKFGSALAEFAKDQDIITIPGLKGREPKEVSMKNLADIIQARMAEILEHVCYEIKTSGVKDKLRGGIVVTGGGAHLRNLTQLIEYISGLDARIGFPNEHLAPSTLDELKSPMYATGIGLVIKSLQTIDMYKNKTGTNEKREVKQRQKWINKLLEKGSEFFNDSIDDVEFK
ncbi:MAG: cell division protein FtsA [Sphingobacteriales bacterium]|jgi:cell division protein FtsA